MEPVLRQSALTSFASPSPPLPSDFSGRHRSVLLGKAPPCRPRSQSNGAAFAEGWGSGEGMLTLCAPSYACKRSSCMAHLFIYFFIYCLYDSVWILAFSDARLFIAVRLFFYVRHSAASQRSFGLFTFPLCHPPFTSHLFFPPEIVLSPLLQTSVRLASSSSSSSSRLSLLCSSSACLPIPSRPQMFFLCLSSI